MAYSIQFELNKYADKKALHRLYILVIYNRSRIRYQFPQKIGTNQWDGEKFTNHPNKTKLTAWLHKEKNELEARLIDLFKNNPHPSIAQVTAAVQNKNEAGETTTLQQLLTIMKEEGHELSDGRKRHYETMISILDEFANPWYLSNFTTNRISAFHESLIEKGYAQNTIWSKFNILKTIRTQAIKRRLIQQDPFALYKAPKYEQNIPVYLTEKEVEHLQKFVEKIDNPEYQQVGWYFLLGCYIGFRISDLKRFNYHLRVHGDKIVVKTKKTGEIVSVKIHRRLETVLEYCKHNQLTVPDPVCNTHIKVIAKLAGIKKKLTMHSSRHSFGMWLADRGVSREDAMELMGITNPATLNVYYRISNARLNRVVDEKLS